MTPAQLRASFLQAAIQGELVPQDPADGNAADLLAAIRAERARLVKEKKLRKPKPLPPIAPDEIPFQIPPSWQWVRLKEVASILYGFPFESELFNTKGEGTPLIRIRDVLSAQTATFTTECVDKAYIVHADEMIVGMDGNFNVNFWKGAPAYLNQRVCKITANRVWLNQKFLFFYLPFALKQIEKEASFVTVKHLSDRHLTQVVVPLPPVAEQERIVAKLEEVLPLCEVYAKDHAALTALDNGFPAALRKSLLQAAIRGELVPQDPADGTAADLLAAIRAERARLVKEKKRRQPKPLPPINPAEIPFPIPPSWQWARLGEVCEYGCGEILEPKEIGTDVWVLELEDIEKGSGHLLAKKTKQDRPISGSRRTFRKGEILFSKLRTYLNKVLIAPDDGVCSSEILPLAPVGKICARYVLHCIRSQYALEYMQKCGYGIKMPRLGTEDGRRLPIPLPPLAEQERIVAKLEALLPLCTPQG